MYEHRTVPPLSRRAFTLRMLQHGGYALVLVAVSLFGGMCGYHWFARYTWTDAFLNTSMLLGGMGPVGELPTESAKIFAGIFALYSGLVFLIATALLLTPVLHRVMHRFHWERQSRDR